ncbi:DUF637 domain-containing protein [Candidatus Odyssella acanthamoebae]|uniref:DUF637 domain-containing protein n=1 Tax=Candidatus Odyssella acanthamoebae TaxID=91604 RepID=A0A077AV55_9PROT|nr:DUF637 domain-containing protein [Candidatus Paracaedibacter acanthamoebae]AIK95503.1 hypothetical protein ID47_00120 [Candidatus Paracaedibacter acanthamoebae]
MGQRTEEHTTYARPKFIGTVNIESRESLVQLVDGQANAFFDHIKQQGGVLEKKFLAELHKSEYKKVQGPGQALMAVIAVAVSIVTCGAGAALATGSTFLAGNATAIAMLDVAVSSVATQFTVGTLQNGGNFLKGAKTLVNKDYIRSLGVSLVTAGITAKIGGAYGIQKPDANFIKIASNPQLLAAHFQYNLLNQTVNTAVRTTLGKESFKGALAEGAKSVAVDTAAAFAANKIGQWYAKGEVNPLEQKALHFGVGFSMGLAAHGRVDEALTAGGAAVLSETMAEGIVGDHESLTEQARQDVQQEGRPLTQENIDKASQVRRQKAANWAKLGTAVTALATRTNVDVAVRAATNAVENNFLTTSVLYGRSDDAFAEMFERNLEEEEKRGKDDKGPETEERGRSRERDPRSHQSKSQSPPRRADASFEKFNRMVSGSRDALYDGQKRFRNGERTMETFLKAHGADWLDTFGYAVKGADFLTGGAVSQAGKLMGDISEGANTKIRRNVRELTGNQYWAQEAGDYATFLGSFFVPGPAAAAKATQLLTMGKIASATAKLVRRIRMADALDLAGISQAPTSKFIYQQYGKSQPIKKTLTRIANENRAPFTAQRSANANRFYDEMRAVANGSTVHQSTPSLSHAPRMSSGSSSGGNPSTRVGASSTFSSSSQGSASSMRQGANGGSMRGDTSLGRNLITGELEPKGKGKAVVRSSDQPKAAKNSSAPKITRDHDRIAHDNYYTRKGERTQQLDWQKQIKNAQPADYTKHTKARTSEEAKRMSASGEGHAQYLPDFNRIELEVAGLKKGTLVKRDGSKGADFYIYKFNDVIGYNNGQPTQWIRVELTKTGKPEYHGHPILEATAKQYLKKSES